MEKHKSLKNGVLKMYGMRIKKPERRLQDLLYKDSSTRIKEFIIDYGPIIGGAIVGAIAGATIQIGSNAIYSKQWDEGVWEAVIGFLRVDPIGPSENLKLSKSRCFLRDDKLKSMVVPSLMFLSHMFAYFQE